MSALLHLLLVSTALFNSFAESAGGFMGVAADVQDIVEEMTQDYKVLVTNTASNSIYLKCASADDTIMGDGSDDDGWWTLENGQALGWTFQKNNFGTTCFWCYANNNGQEARDSGNWYIHQDVFGWDGCDGPANQDGVDENYVTTWEVRNDGIDRTKSRERGMV
ncbi:unnamed protein product, partial [Mesorhabditis belari]|uniref:Uncharacterized protein n=1 Tax=Mesorhabditis belari TaxID=2138241 RepID=A0AAF3F9R2_9BILA